MTGKRESQQSGVTIEFNVTLMNFTQVQTTVDNLFETSESPAVFFLNVRDFLNLIYSN